MGKAKWEPFDLLKFTFASDPRLSPSGEALVFAEHRVLAEENGYRSTLVWMDLQGEGRRPFTSGEFRDTHPRFSPDGRYLAFLSDRPVLGDECGSQLWVMPADGGEPRPLTRIVGGVRGFVWSPESNRLAFVARVDPERGLEEVGAEQASGEGLQALYQQYNADVKHIKNILYKFEGEGHLWGKRMHVGIVDLCVDGVDMPKPRLLTSGDYDHSDPAFSPDGRFVAVAACRVPEPDLKRFKDVWLFPVEGEEAPVQVTQSRGDVSLPSFSPDGRRLAYLGIDKKLPGWYDHHTLWVAELEEDGGPKSAPTNLTGHQDVVFGISLGMDTYFPGPGPELVWGPEGEALYHITAERGATQLVRVDATTGDCRLVTTGDRAIFNADLRPDLGWAVMMVSRAEHPGELVRLDFSDPEGVLPAGEFSDAVLDPSLQRQAETLLYRTNEALFREKYVAVPERFTARTSEDSPAVDAWILKPQELDESSDPVPVLLEIHGGPSLMYSSAFLMEFQLLVAQGYAVVFSNPRGSSGYGEAFRTAIQPGWGTVDYDDLMAVMDEALQRYPFLDDTRTGVLGGSYGGYMTNWIIGHTDRFQAAVTMRCVSNFYSTWGTCDLGPMESDVHGGSPWEVPEKYWRVSPITFLGNAVTPTLIIHSEEDQRCPMEQAEQVYSTLKFNGVDTEFLRYPNENHGLSRAGKPWHRIHRLTQIQDWFRRYL